MVRAEVLSNILYMRRSSKHGRFPNVDPLFSLVGNVDTLLWAGGGVISLEAKSLEHPDSKL